MKPDCVGGVNSALNTNVGFRTKTEPLTLIDNRSSTSTTETFHPNLIQAENDHASHVFVEFKSAITLQNINDLTSPLRVRYFVNITVRVVNTDIDIPKDHFPIPPVMVQRRDIINVLVAIVVVERGGTRPVSRMQSVARTTRIVLLATTAAAIPSSRIVGSLRFLRFLRFHRGRRQSVIARMPFDSGLVHFHMQLETADPTEPTVAGEARVR